MKGIVLFQMIVVIFGVTLARELPDFIHVCKRTDPNISKCIKESIENFQPYLKSGVPEYNIPSLEPLLLDELTATLGDNVKFNLQDVLVHGASNFSLKEFKSNVDTLTFIGDLYIPTLAIEGKYDGDGKILLLRIRGKGDMFGNFTDCKGHIKVQANKRKEKDGSTSVRVVEIKVKMAVGSGRLILTNLFGGDPILGQAINEVINSNLDAFLQELQPYLESAISNTFIKIGNSILSQFTYEVLFPES